MDFSLSEEQQMLRDSVDKFLADHYSAGQREAIVAEPQGFSSDNWTKFAELGWLSIPFSEAQGGYGGGIVEVATLMESFGKVLVAEPYLPGILLAGQLIARGDNEAYSAEQLPKLISGELQATFAWLERNARFDLNHVETRAQKKGDDYVLSGSKALVLNGEAADVIVLAARTAGNVDDADGISLFAVDARDPAIERQSFRLMDGQRVINITFKELKVPESQMLTAEGGALPLIQQVVDEAVVALCAEAVGAMDYLYRATVEYCNTRQQFGTPIGKFQALQHRMVDMFMATEQCRSLLVRAICSVQDDLPECQQDVAALKAMVGRYGREVAEEAVQLHGAMGVTNEMPIGFYLKRLMMIDTYFGNADYHRRRFCNLRYSEHAEEPALARAG